MNPLTTCLNLRLYAVIEYLKTDDISLLVKRQEAFEKMLGPFATASRRIAIHQVSLLSHAATIARRLRIDVHNDNDNNGNA